MADPSSILQESLALESAQQYSQMLQQIQDARRTYPHDRGLAIRHGRVLELNKQFKAAQGVYRQLWAAQPKTQESELVLGLLRSLIHSSEFSQAESLLHQLGERLSDQADVKLCRAVLAREAKDFTTALRHVEAVLSSQPGHKWACYERARLHLIHGKPDEAIQLLESNINRRDLHGDSLDLWLETLRELKRDIYAEDRLKQYASSFPQKVEFIFGLGVLAHRNGEIAVARPAFQKALELSPRNPRILHEYGVMERIAGDLPRSMQLIEESLTINPEQPSALRTFGTDYKYSYGDPAFVRLNYAAARLADVSLADQVQLHYALGKAFDDVKELDSAFRHYEIAGAKKRKLEHYDEAHATNMANLIKQHVTKANLSISSLTGCASNVPVFILGMPRSGTSLIEQILASHPDIYGAGELKFLTTVIDNMLYGTNRLNFNNSEPAFAYDQNAGWAERGQRYLERIQSLAPDGARRIVDKMPGNYLMLGLIRAILPNARIIHSRRHPVETCLSCYRINFAEGQLWSYNLRELGRHYRSYWDLMKHWEREFPGEYLDVRYEDNVADVEVQARKIIDYLGLQWHDGCLEFYNTDRPVKTASSTQVKRPIYTTSVNRWRRYEQYLQPLLDELGDIVPAYEAEIAHLDGD